MALPRHLPQLTSPRTESALLPPRTCLRSEAVVLVRDGDAGPDRDGVHGCVWRSLATCRSLPLPALSLRSFPRAHASDLKQWSSYAMVTPGRIEMVFMGVYGAPSPLAAAYLSPH